MQARPDVTQVDGLAVGPGPERVVHDVDGHRTGKGVGHDERRRREVVHAHVRVDPAFEVAVAGQHRCDGEVVLVDGCRYLGLERPRVADACRASEADQLEAQRVERFLQSGSLEVVDGDPRSRGKGRLHPWFRTQTAFDRLLREQPGGDHHLRVRSVGAARDGGDHDVTMIELELGAAS